MPSPDHRLERRASLLATAVKDRITTVRDAVAPPGQRPPFTVQQPRAAVLDWWRKNIDTDLGKEVLSRLPPQDVMDLKVALARHIEQDPLYPPEEMNAGMDPGAPPPGTTPMPSQAPSSAPPMGPPAMQVPLPPAQPMGTQPPFVS